MTRKKTNIIEINGHRYDALTGDRLTGGDSRHANKGPKQPKPVEYSQSVKPHPVAKRPRHQPAKHVAAHTPEPSHTLMRRAVKKPASGSKHHIRAQGHTNLPAKSAGLQLSRPIGRVDEKRLRHAKAVPKSRLISRFPQITPGSFQPTPIQTGHAIARIDHNKRSQHLESAPHKKPTTAELLETALQRANSHEQKPVKPAHRSRAKRSLAIGGTAALAVLILGVIFTQNLPNVRLQMASAKAGFTASLPGYRPSGYSLGVLNYSDGVVAARFSSNSDNRRYTVTQERSSWNDAMLLNNFVVPRDNNYQRSQVKGLTVYLYGDRDATWLKNGVWYIIQGNGSLSDRQLLELAASL